jgi:COP9 signalosome complex subunit 4
VLSDGLTVLERAMIEHNMVAVGRLYRNISFSSLGELLSIPGDVVRCLGACELTRCRRSGLCPT